MFVFLLDFVLTFPPRNKYVLRMRNGKENERERGSERESGNYR